jgi:hypothetical protein
MLTHWVVAGDVLLWGHIASCARLTALRTRLLASVGRTSAVLRGGLRLGGVRAHMYPPRPVVSSEPVGGSCTWCVRDVIMCGGNALVVGWVVVGVY